MIPQAPTPTITVSNELADLLTAVWHDRLKPGAVVLSYLASRNFNVIRYPTRPDRSLDGKSSHYQQTAEKLDSYSAAELDALARQLAAATRLTRQYLLQRYPQGYVELHRAISPLSVSAGQYIAANREVDDVALFPKLAQAAILAGVPEIELDVDIVSGWSTTALQRYGTLHLTCQWPIEQILLVSDFLTRADGSAGPLESNEWLCVNTNPKGLLTFAVDQIRVVDLPEKYLQEIARHQDIKELAVKLQNRASQQPWFRGVAARPNFGSLKAGKIPAPSLWRLLADWWRYR